MAKIPWLSQELYCPSTPLLCSIARQPGPGLVQVPHGFEGRPARRGLSPRADLQFRFHARGSPAHASQNLGVIVYGVFAPGCQSGSGTVRGSRGLRFGKGGHVMDKGDSLWARKGLRNQRFKSPLMRSLRKEAKEKTRATSLLRSSPQLIKPVLQVPSPCALLRPLGDSWRAPLDKLHPHRSSYRSLIEPSILVLPRQVVTTHPDSADTTLQL
ncbi:hypothetical protein B0T16DRAFT_45567 [Cercophora newfieldiana]|uniref:Uncharacterized protein n=1 Tax=Cercophora newfieldiana TaxID=92897 RepID=A0AA39YSA0_9PEZI|nr:hypothetical protein B0T16DRAFT_45567 [Cercophora newfieldiana]